MKHWIFEDNINTDLITPGRYNITTDPKELAKVAFIEHLPEFAKTVKPGDLIIAGKNFGCGSSRETAVTALKHSGIQAIIGQSFARIFFRNCLNQGMLALTGDTSSIQPNDELVLDLSHKQVLNKTTGKTIAVTFPDVMLVLHEAGGIIPYIKIHGMDSIQKLFASQ